MSMRGKGFLLSTLSLENNFADISAKCSSRHQGESVNFLCFVTQVTLQTDDMDLAGDVIQSLASYLGIEVCKLKKSVVMETPGST